MRGWYGQCPSCRQWWGEAQAKSTALPACSVLLVTCWRCFLLPPLLVDISFQGFPSRDGPPRGERERP